MYGLSKLIAEQTAAYYRRRFDQSIVVVRFGTTCGPNKGERHGSSRITSLLVENAAAGKPTRIAQGGDQRDDVIYNRDVAHGLVLACLAPGLRHSTYHLGSGSLISLQDLAAAVRRVVPDAAIEIGPGLDYMQLGIGNYCLMSTSRARRELGFRARYALDDWVADYVDVMRASTD
jgi:UDP-glucose 4-epimerase